MSIPFCSRALARQRAVTTARHPVSNPTSCLQRRSLTLNPFELFKSRKAPPQPKNRLTEEYLRKKPDMSGLTREQGGLAPSSIFEEEGAAATAPASTEPGAPQKQRRNAGAMAAALDIHPNRRRRWERRMVIKDIHKRGRLSRAQIIKRKEREVMVKSHNIKTSVKKLGPLARQIAGKPLEEAIVQMRFSKKKAAKSVKEHLERARAEAIVAKGMGLGISDGAVPQSIITKEGKRMKVTNPTALYVSQAWVGKGPYSSTPDYRARGQIHMMKNPSTHLQVVLKEEATRIREHHEMLAKKERRKLWTPLPNRPISGQRQYYSW